MNAWMIGMSYAGGMVACSAWAGEWARRKGLSPTVWGVAGAATGPMALAAVGLWRAQAALCPHCLQPMRFEQRYCPTCRTAECAATVPMATPRDGAARASSDVLLSHGFFEPTSAAA
jgi:hypothetical protein